MGSFYETKSASGLPLAMEIEPRIAVMLHNLALDRGGAGAKSDSISKERIARIKRLKSLIRQLLREVDAEQRRCEERVKARDAVRVQPSV